MRKKRELTDPKIIKELDDKVKELCLMDFELFCKTFNIDKTKLFVCFEIQKKKSYKQIGIKLGIGKSAVVAIAKQCVPD